MAKLIKSIPNIPVSDDGRLIIKPQIKVIGVGGGGGNAVNYMYGFGIENVDFLIINTDKQALTDSPIPDKLQLGAKGLGAGNNPEMGKAAAEQSADAIRQKLSNDTKVVFVTACLGKGTGTGAAPVVARIAKEMGLLTIAIVSIPFRAEGPRRLNQAINGLKELRNNVDSIIVVTSERIKEEFGDFPVSEAFNQANKVFATAAKGLADMISKKGIVSLGQNDVRAVMENSGDALLGIGEASGQDRVFNALQEALDSTLLVKQDIKKAKNILIDFAFSKSCQVTAVEIDNVKKSLQESIDENANIMTGIRLDESLKDSVRVTVVLVGLEMTDEEVSYRSVNRLLDKVVSRREVVSAPRISEPQTASEEQKKREMEMNYLGVSSATQAPAFIPAPAKPALQEPAKETPRYTQEQLDAIYGGSMTPIQRPNKPEQESAPEPVAQPAQEAVAAEVQEAEPTYVWGDFNNLNSL